MWFCGQERTGTRPEHVGDVQEVEAVEETAEAEAEAEAERSKKDAEAAASLAALAASGAPTKEQALHVRAGCVISVNIMLGDELLPYKYHSCRVISVDVTDSTISAKVKWDDGDAAFDDGDETYGESIILYGQGAFLFKEIDLPGSHIARLGKLGIGNLFRGGDSLGIKSACSPPSALASSPSPFTGVLLCYPLTPQQLRLGGCFRMASLG